MKKNTFNTFFLLAFISFATITSCKKEAQVPTASNASSATALSLRKLQTTPPLTQTPGQPIQLKRGPSGCHIW
jgi:hypothetical protein